ncbi:TPA: phosphoenolpyruvate synthase [Candidatus Woesearchaeota archaeon]|nr:phosphoenolpyruvate synthase [Candidatus Woesearchaeota archaeon]HIH55281.1 phosphoenolpyruvate synthase [Candidatus Woesearchaeota archaeon]HIJ01012.1 phosphoenolpyruvate synthase [Candidatus Woesearchaeota archaeon]HIJ13295.1 phosphoenolpyruvate synthase [Candidatus Woesearchaeota archaeon]
MNKGEMFILWFDQLGIEDVPFVGGKNASLGEMYVNLTSKGIKVPNGFALTAYAYRYFLEKAGIKERIKEILSDLNTHDMQNLSERGQKVRDTILRAEFPPELKSVVLAAYRDLCGAYSRERLDTDVAVRSSATAEDLPDASFAGQQETYLNVKGDFQILEAVKKCIASLFTNRAISYRVDKGFDHFSIALSVGVQKMVRSDLACSGVMFSVDTESGFKDVVFITGSWGLGENIVQGAVNPDEYYAFKPTLKQGFKPIINKKIGSKELKMIYSHEGNKPVKNIPVPKSEQDKFVLNDDEVLTLARWSCIIEDHYSWKAGHFKPMDMEWAKDGLTGELFIVQARPETVVSQKNHNVLETYILKQKGNIIVKGKSVGERIGSGEANVIKNVHDIGKFRKGQVLVTEMTDPDWEPIMKIASAIVTNRGGRTCFAGNTKILTNIGFMTMEDVYYYPDHSHLKVPSLNRNTLKIEWKPIVAAMKKKSDTMKILVSQTGRAENNILELTPDHKMINIRDGLIADTQIKDMILNEECVSVAQFIPGLNTITEKNKKLAYTLGAVSTDGHIYTSRTRGEVVFVQKPTIDKKEFISAVIKNFSELYNKDVSIQSKPTSQGYIRGSKVSGNANAYRMFSKQVAYELKEEQALLMNTLLSVDTEFIYNFLAGVIDGDGSFNQTSNRIHIYISKEWLAQSVIVGCLRLGIVPQVTNNRNIYNIQIVEKIDDILRYTKRIKGSSQRKMQATRFFNAKQIFSQKNHGSSINNRRKKNLMISDKELREYKIDIDMKEKINKLLNSDLRQLRTNQISNCKETDVYNITVEDNHNYLVFTGQYTPIIVNNCHAAIISRELGIPCVVGTIDGTEKIKTGQNITVSCAEGDAGNVYDGILSFEIQKVDLQNLPKTKTKIMMNCGNPEEVFDLSFIPNEGVGLAREEFIIMSYIKAHPLALLNYHSQSPEIKEEIDKISIGYDDKVKFFVDKLAQGIGMIAAAFYPKDVILRFSDFKTNEYANLIGGKAYEPKEDNPMIGWRGASRYYSPGYKDGFALECKAILKVRNEYGLTNLKVMIPFCRTIDEGKKVLYEMEKHGLKKGENGLQVYMMCEIPSNVILSDQFSEIFDGFSIGSNDLTQLTLGLDRDSEIVAHIYDERNEAVKRLLRKVIADCKQYHRKIGICGQCVSDYPEMTQFVVECGIDSISLNADTVIKATLNVAEVEKRLGIKPE